MKELPELFTAVDAQYSIGNKELSALECSVIKWDKIREALYGVHDVADSKCGCCLYYNCDGDCPLGGHNGDDCCYGLFAEAIRSIKDALAYVEELYTYILDKKDNIEGRND
jgi:hypothetical protein